MRGLKAISFLKVAIIMACCGAVSHAGEKPSIPDYKLLDQDGNKVRFYTDMVKGKLVVVGFFYTSCTYVCPMQGNNFARLQTLLGDRLGRDVFLISISTDPAADTPQRLKAYAARLGAKKGWTFMTGEQSLVNRFLKEFTGEGTATGPHSSTVMVGNDRSGEWIIVDGLKLAEELMKIINGLADT